MATTNVLDSIPVGGFVDLGDIAAQTTIKAFLPVTTGKGALLRLKNTVILFTPTGGYVSDGATIAANGWTKFAATTDIPTVAASATKLATARAFSITGGATAAGVNFDGTGAVALNVTALDASKLGGTIPSAVLATTQVTGTSNTSIATTAFVQQEINAKATTVMNYKGTVSNQTALLALTVASLKVGDVYNQLDNGNNYVWSGGTTNVISNWDKLGDSVDLSGYVKATSADYIKSASVSGKVITFTKGNGTTQTFTDTDTIYTHPTFGTAGTYASNTAGTLAWGGAIIVPKIVTNASGHATVTNVTLNLPAAPTTITGNAGTATKWATARTITLAGDVSGSTSIDGSGDATITVTVNATYKYFADVTTQTGFADIPTATFTPAAKGGEIKVETFTGETRYFFKPVGKYAELLKIGTGAWQIISGSLSY